MCLTIHYHDLGAADALLDLALGWIVLRPTLTQEEQREAVARLLAAKGVPQPETAADPVCVCGEPLSFRDVTVTGSKPIPAPRGATG